MTRPLKTLAKGAIASLGYRTDNRCIVFESDDWGSIRLPSAAALASYKRKYPEHDLDHYQSYDGLESAGDIDRLNETLGAHVTERGFPVFTLNYATANPRFEDMEICEPALGFFAYEPITSTYERYYGNLGPLEALCAHPETLIAQLHAREHLNATQWMANAAHDERLAYAFGLAMIGMDPGRYCAMDALNINNRAIDRVDYLCEAAALFERIFGCASESFIPPCYAISDSDSSVLSELGVRTLQGGRFRNIPKASGKLNGRFNIFGKRNVFSQVQLIRNCQFEPSKYYHLGKSEDACVADAIANLEQAFRFRQPAVFCSHRVNYTSVIDVDNREYSLRCLDRLLKYIVREHPDVIFTTSDRLGRFIAHVYEQNEEDLTLLAPETHS